jgi:hypothetical protein
MQWKREARRTPQDNPPALRRPRTRPGAYKLSSDLQSPAIAPKTPRTRPAIRLEITGKRPASRNDAGSCLNDISDFNTRKDVAQLMAVAPGLPIQDLHDMLADLNGDFAAAKKQAIRVSRVPSMHPSIKAEASATRGPSGQNSDQAHKAYGDEVLIKIDPSVDFLEWVRTSPVFLRINDHY